MLEPDGPYSSAEIREMRRLIVAAGLTVDLWVQRTRRSAEFVRALSPEQADVITLQAVAIAAAPEDLGDRDEIEAAAALFAAVPPRERPNRLWHLLLEIRHRHYPRGS